MVLMRLAAALSERPGVRQSAALMGTPANRELLASAGLASPDLAGRGAGRPDARDRRRDRDGRGIGPRGGEGVLRRAAPRARGHRPHPPRTLASALRQLPGANLALVSVPGAHATLEAMTALRHGLHVFLFSDNVAIEDEIALKRLAASRRLLCMGPDCGTAYLNGVGLGFANVVPRGRIGCVAASGTGLQAVASHVAALGEGISHGIGVGGRDLSEAVGAPMTSARPRAAGRGSGHGRHRPDLEAAGAARHGRARCDHPDARSSPSWCAASGRDADGVAAGHRVDTLEGAAAAAVALARGRPVAGPRVHRPRRRARPPGALGALERRGPALLGLYTGGTLAHEARLLLEPLLGPLDTGRGRPPGDRPRRRRIHGRPAASHDRSVGARCAHPRRRAGGRRAARRHRAGASRSRRSRATARRGSP